MDSSFRDWAGFPIDLLDLIVEKLDPLSDCLRICAVCTQWRDAAIEIHAKRNQSFAILKESRKKLPMLVITTESMNDEKRGFYSVFESITYNIELPVCYRNKFVGSSHGWLICIGKNFVITLLNPFTKSCIDLPTLKDGVIPGPDFEFYEDYFEYFVLKATLTADPLVCPNNYAVLVIYGDMHRLAVYKSCDRSWDLIELLPTRDNVLEDIICYKDYLYAVTNTSKLIKIDINSGIYKTIVGMSRFDADGLYLVESLDGELLLIKRCWDFGRDEYEPDEDEDDVFNKSIDFKVLKVEHPIEEKFGTLVRVNDIGEQALFVGNNHSVSISTIDFPKCKPNSIYYTDEHHSGFPPPYKYNGVDEDLGFYTLKDGSFHPLDDAFLLNDAFEFTQPSIWFVPNPE